MGLERIIQKTRTIGRKVLIGAALVGSLYLENCSKVDITTPSNITIDIKSVGMVTGKVTVPIIENNKLSYAGFPNADVIIAGTDFKTKSLLSGDYAIDNVPAGAYNISASESSYNYKKDVVSAIVIKQKTNIAPDHKLTPIGLTNQILYGRALKADKSTPLANQEVRIHVMTYPNSGAGTFVGSTISSSDGSYAFYHGYNGYVLIANGKQLKFTDTNFNYIILSSTGNELTNKNVYEPN